MIAWLVLRSKRCFRARPIAVVVLALLLLTACTQTVGPREDETTTDFRQISRAYELVLDGKKRPPKDISELRPILHDLHQGKLGDDPEKVLTSARDGHPYVIVYGVNLGGSNTADIFIYEKRGKDGSRYVMNTQRIVSEVADDSFLQQPFAKGHRPEK